MKQRRRPEKRKELKRKKKAARPKRSNSAFIYFMKSKIAALRQKKENANLPITEIMKQAAQEWKTVPESEKKTFINEAAKDKKRYEAEKKEAAKKAPPKRPASGYFAYLSEIRPQIKKEKPSLTITEIAKLGGKKWKALSEGERQKYNTKANKLLEEYKKKYSSFVKKA